MTTIEGLDPELRDRWVRAFVDAGASQCGFCTPGIVVRLASLQSNRGELDEEMVKNALAAHLCRCTGWRSILEAARLAGACATPAPGAASVDPAERDYAAASRRATLEGGTPQLVGPQVVVGAGGFADDVVPADSLVAVPDGRGGYCVADGHWDARARVPGTPGRRTTEPLRYPLEVPEGNWVLALRTTFVEPAYLEPDASWCEPGGDPASPLANGGAFGGKLGSPATEAARFLAAVHERPVRVAFSREDAVRMGPKRPPIAVGLRDDGSGALLVARTPGSADLGSWVRAFSAVLPLVAIEEVAVAGPPVSAEIRAAGWGEAAALKAALDAIRRGHAGPGHPVEVKSPGGGRATVEIDESGSVSVAVAAGDVLDEVVLRSYVIGATHQALGWVRSEAIAVSRDGAVLDLTIRSFGIIPARHMPEVVVRIEDDDREPVRVSDAVFAAVAAADWLAGGLEPQWPVARGSWSGSRKRDPARQEEVAN